MLLPSCLSLCRTLPAAAIPLFGVLVLCGSGAANAKLPEKNNPSPRAVNEAAVPIYAVRSRFSGQSGVIAFTAERPQTRLSMPDRTNAAPRQGTVQSRFTQASSRNLVLSSGYGLRMHPILGTMREHRGVDLAAATGSPILAPSSGVVGRAGWSGGYGIAVSLEHGGGIETRYGHLSRLNVVVGQAVREGDILGYVGSTGLSTGPHLHYEVRVNGQAVNPIPEARTTMRRQRTPHSGRRTAH